MGLPKIDLPIYEMTLPSSGKKIKYRPFTVKEEKILLTAQESKDIEQSILSVQQVVNNCVFDIDVDQISMFDLEYMMLMLRSKSVDNNISFTIKDPDTNEKVQLELDLDSVKITKDENHTNTIKIDDTYTILMRYPTIKEYLLLLKDIKDPNAEFNVLINCMDKLVSKDEVFIFSELSEQEIKDFAEELTSNTVKKIKNFFETMPALRHEIQYTNKNGDKRTFVIEGMKTFFI